MLKLQYLSFGSYVHVIYNHDPSRQKAVRPGRMLISETICTVGLLKANYERTSNTNQTKNNGQVVLAFK